MMKMIKNIYKMDNIVVNVEKYFIRLWPIKILDHLLQQGALKWVADVIESLASDNETV